MACIAFGCNNRTPGNRAKKVPGLTFHKFPKDTKQRAEWVKAVRRADWTPSYCSSLCSEHFKESDIDRTPFRTFLRPNAVPSIFKGFPKCLQKKPSACVNPVSSSPPPKQVPSDETLASRIENVGSTNEIAVDQNKPEGIRRKNDCDRDTVVIVSDTDDYKSVLNGPSDANRRIVVSDKLKQARGPSSALARFGNVGSTNDKVTAKNLTAAAPTIGSHDKIDRKKIMVLVVPGTPAYKYLQNSKQYENRSIVVSDRLIPNKRLDSSLSNTHQTSSSSAVSEAAPMRIGKNKHKKDPLLLVDDGVLGQRRKELEEVVKVLLKKKKIWVQKIRRTSKKLKKLRNKYIRFNKKNPTIFGRTSQPVVHFLAQDVQNG